MARDATARLYDVDEDSVVLKQQQDTGPKYMQGTITFSAKQGRLVDLDKLHESIWATRLSGGTRMHLMWLEVTAVGEVAVDKNQVILRVTGSDQQFVLVEDPSAGAQPGEATAWKGLLAAAGQGENEVRVTGRVEGWSGHFPKLLSRLPEKPRRLLVSDFKP